MFKNLLLLGSLFILLSACSKEEESKSATLHYYFELSTEDSETRLVEFDFQYMRAHRSDPREIRSVYLDPGFVQISNQERQKHYIGASSIEAQFIDAYDISLSGFRLIRPNDTLELRLLNSPQDQIPCNIQPDKGDNLDLYFDLNLDRSLILDSAGFNWIRPQFQIRRGF
ncbi:hypothetical protein [Croceimicrobium sp.]|uniref:hypothetical protein n=1 Tax=Croceimicrobium sp. TaxID=2828340 RepID=UPI003BAC90F6